MFQPYIIFSDLDGTLLDYHTYSFEPALPAIEYITNSGIPLILVSSKTAEEIVFYQRAIGLIDLPFVVENGSAIYTPIDYFSNAGSYDVRGKFQRYVLGKTYQEINTILIHISEQYRYIINGFHNASREEIKSKTALSIKEVEMAQQREFSIPLFYDPEAERILKKEIPRYNLQILYGGRFMHLLGKVDKGEAMRIIMDGYRQRLDNEDLKSIALGDSLNDFEMLAAADFPILVKRHDGTYEMRQKVENIIYSPDIGPAGWNRSLSEILRIGGRNE